MTQGRERKKEECDTYFFVFVIPVFSVTKYSVGPSSHLNTVFIWSPTFFWGPFTFLVASKLKSDRRKIAFWDARFCRRCCFCSLMDEVALLCLPACKGIKTVQRDIFFPLRKRTIQVKCFSIVIFKSPRESFSCEYRTHFQFCNEVFVHLCVVVRAVHNGSFRSPRHFACNFFSAPLFFPAVTIYLIISPTIDQPQSGLRLITDVFPMLFFVEKTDGHF